MTVEARAMGRPLARLEGRQKVLGSATYAFEHPLPDPAYVHPVQATIARGTVSAIDVGAAEAVPGVLFVLTADNARALADTDDRELAILQDHEVGFRGQIIGAVVAETAEVAREAAALVEVTYAEQPHDTELTADHPDLYAPEQVNPSFETDTGEGDVDAAMARATYTVDEVYRTPMEHNHPMEPHTAVAVWEGGERPGESGGPAALTLYASTQSVHGVRSALAPVLGLDVEQVRVISPHVGGGFGSKGMPHAHDVLAALAAERAGGRPVKLALTRQQMFTLAGHRTPTIQRVRLAADAEGRLIGTEHDAVEHTSRIKEFAEQTTVGTRKMYASSARKTRHRLAALDVPVPSWMRAPGEAPGSFGLECALDELAVASGVDPIELRHRNEPEVDPESGLPWADRRLLECLDEGARRFGWSQRGPRGTIRGEWQVGLGVAAAAYPFNVMPGSRARIEFDGSTYDVSIGAADIGTGAWTVLTQVSADALGVPVASVRMHLGDTDLPTATVAGGSSGTSSWGMAIVAAADRFRQDHGERPAAGASSEAEAGDHEDSQRYAVHSFGAQFAEVAVHRDTGEVRVPRMLGVFSAGRIVNPRTARSQLIGGMTMGLSTALHEHTVIDHRLGVVATKDLADYHIAAHADVARIEATWVGGDDPHASPMGSRGLGEIGITGAAAAIANAAAHATGIRVRELPLTPEKFLR